jgi:hypothetical protein
MNKEMKEEYGHTAYTTGYKNKIFDHISSHNEKKISTFSPVWS